METKTLKPTGPAAALKIAYDAVTKVLNYSHKKLREETRWDYKTLRKIRDGELGNRSPVTYYLCMLMQILTKAYEHSIVTDGGTKAIPLKNAFAEIACELCYMHLPKIANEDQ